MIKKVLTKNYPTMKKFIFILMISHFFMTGYSQTEAKVVPDPRLIEAFGQETVDFYMENSPSTITYYNFFLKESYTVMDFPTEKKADPAIYYPVLEKKAQYKNVYSDYLMQEPEQFNILLYDITVDAFHGASFLIPGSRKILTFRSGTEIQLLYKEHLAKGR